MKKYARESILLFFINIFASFLNYVCQLVMARYLSVSDFGTVNTVFSYLLIVGVPGSTLTMVVSKKFAEINHDDNHLTSSLML